MAKYDTYFKNLFEKCVKFCEEKFCCDCREYIFKYFAHLFDIFYNDDTHTLLSLSENEMMYIRIGCGVYDDKEKMIHQIFLIK